MVTFDSQGGSSVEPMVVTAGGAISTLPTSTKSGYRFEGWYTTGGEKLTTSTTIDKPLTCYAHWTANSSGGGEEGGNGGSGSGGGSSPSVPSVIAAKEKVDVSPLFSGKSVKKYTAEPKSVASVSKKGVVTGKSSGSVKITAWKKVGKKYEAVGSCTIRVEAPKFSQKTLTADHKGTYINARQYLTGITSLQASSFKSSKPSVASVDSATGQVTVNKAGSTKLYAYFGSGKNAAKVSMTLSVKLPKLNKSKINGLRVDKSSQLTLKNTTKTPSWRSENTGIARVDSNGLVTGVSPGTTRINASVNGESYSCTVTVKAQKTAKKSAKRQ